MVMRSFDCFPNLQIISFTTHVALASLFVSWTMISTENHCYILNLYFIIIFIPKNLKAENSTFCIGHVKFKAFCLKISLVIEVPELLQLRTKFRRPWTMWENSDDFVDFFLGEMNWTQTLYAISLNLYRFGKHLKRVLNWIFYEFPLKEYFFRLDRKFLF